MFFIGPGFGLLIFILDIIAIIDVIKHGKDPGMKIVWILLILCLPLLGMLLYFLLGRKSA